MFPRFSWWLVLKFIKIRLEDKYQSKEKIIIWYYILISTFRTSPRRCSRGSPGGWSWISFLVNSYINTKRRYDNWFKMAEIGLFSTKRRAIELCATKLIKEKMSGRLIWYVLAHFWENLKKFKLKSQDTKKEQFVRVIYQKSMFFPSCDLIFNFYAIFSKMRISSISTLPVIFFMKFGLARIFFVERHLLGVVLKDHLVVG